MMEDMSENKTAQMSLKYIFTFLLVKPIKPCILNLLSCFHSSSRKLKEDVIHAALDDLKISEMLAFPADLADDVPFEENVVVIRIIDKTGIYGLCSQSPNQGERSWEHSPETYSQKFRLWLPWRAPPCACLVCVHSEHVLSQIESASHNSPREPQGQVRLSSHRTDDVTE